MMEKRPHRSSCTELEQEVALSRIGGTKQGSLIPAVGVLWNTHLFFFFLLCKDGRCWMSAGPWQAVRACILCSGSSPWSCSGCWQRMGMQGGGWLW